jgi:hypothetical protein
MSEEDTEMALMLYRFLKDQQIVTVNSWYNNHIFINIKDYTMRIDVCDHMAEIYHEDDRGCSPDARFDLYDPESINKVYKLVDRWVDKVWERINESE